MPSRRAADACVFTGKRVIIAKSGIPMAKLVPLDEPKRRKFKFGARKGVFSDEAVEAIEAPWTSSKRC